MSAETTLWLALALPFAGALLIGLAGRWPNLREAITLATAAGLFVLVVSLLPTVRAGARPAVTLLEVLPGLRLGLAAEPLGTVFALVASFLWIMTSLYSIGYMRANAEHHQTRFYACFAVSLGAAMGVALAADLLTLFVFYEILTISTYPLVVHAGTAEARAAGRTYLGYLLGTSITLLLVAIGWTWTLAGRLDFVPGGLLAGAPFPDGLLVLYVLGVGKAAIMPLHRWLPAAMVAPAPVSALLHAVAVVKAGVFTILKVAVHVFGLDLLPALETGEALAWLAAATMLIAGGVALTQDDLKRRLAYSTVSQLSYIVMAALVATPASVLGGGLHIAAHAFGKITLFFCAGSIYTVARRARVSEMDGIGRRMPITMAAFLLASLGIIGLPPLAGMWSKWFLAQGLVQAGSYGLLAVLLGGSLLSAGYLLPVAARAFRKPRDEGGASGVSEAPALCLAATIVAAAGGIVLFLFPDPLIGLLRQLVAHP